MAIDQDNLREKLIEVLQNTFNEGELRTLAFDLNINLEDLPGGGKSNRAREIVAFAERRGRLEDLAAFVQEQRPDQNLIAREQKKSINVNIGNVGIGGDLSFGQSIYTSNISKAASNTSDIKAILEKMRQLIETSMEKSPGERDLKFALENVQAMENELDREHLRPNLLLHRAQDTGHILESVSQRSQISGRRLIETDQAGLKNLELIELTKTLRL